MNRLLYVNTLLVSLLILYALPGCQGREALVDESAGHPEIALPEPIDFDDDGQDEFLFWLRYITSGSGAVGRVGFSGNRDNLVLEVRDNQTSALEHGVGIGPLPTWIEDIKEQLNASKRWGRILYICHPGGEGSWVGPWVGVKDKYIGLRAVREDGYHYGWAKVSVDTSGSALSIRIHDAFLHPQPDQPVRAGVKE